MPHVRRYTTPEQLTAAIVQKFDWMQQAGLRVAAIWLNPKDINLAIENLDVFDSLSPRHPLLATFPKLRGYLYGVLVFESIIVREEHIAMIQDGFGLHMQILDSSACMAL